MNVSLAASTNVRKIVVLSDILSDYPANIVPGELPTRVVMN